MGRRTTSSQIVWSILSTITCLLADKKFDGKKVKKQKNDEKKDRRGKIERFSGSHQKPIEASH